MKASVISVAAVCLLLIGGASLFVWSGLYNIGATEPHWEITEWFIEKVRDRSIAANSSELRFPSPEDPAQASAAVPHYDGMCRFCHGAPGRARHEFAKGLYPVPPPLMSGIVQERADAELYWIVENGIKMTGMPAFGPTHEKEDLLGILALVRILPDLSAQAYAEMVRTSGAHKEGGGHHRQDSAAHGGKEPAEPHEGEHHHEH